MKSSNKTIKLLFAGDYSPRERIQRIIEKCGHDSFDSVKSLFDNVNCAIVNYETVVADASDKPISKNGTHLFTSPKSVDTLKWLGVSVVTLANNHFMDFGEHAAQRTIRMFDDNGIKTVGAGKNIIDAQSYLVVEIAEKKIAFVNACEREFSIAGTDSFGCNPLDPIDISYQIKDARQKADYVVCVFHGGNEHYQLPSPRMKKWYRFFVDCGADAVINHHQHCFSGYEVYRNKPIFYGLGNFCFDSASDNRYRHQTWNYGFLVELTLSDNHIDFVIFPYEQCWEIPGVFLLQEHDVFNNRMSELNKIIQDDGRLETEFRLMANRKRSFYLSPFKPYSNRLLSSLNSRGLFPSFIKRSNIRNLSAMMNCVSHFDIIKEILQ